MKSAISAILPFESIPGNAFITSSPESPVEGDEVLTTKDQTDIVTKDGKRITLK